MFVNVRYYGANELLYEVNPYDAAAGTLKGLTGYIMMIRPGSCRPVALSADEKLRRFACLRDEAGPAASLVKRLPFTLYWVRKGTRIIAFRHAVSGLVKRSGASLSRFGLTARTLVIMIRPSMPVDMMQ